MKTTLFKLSIVAISLFLTMEAYSQSSSQKKTCINIVEITNGKTITIDTCFTGLSDAEIQKQLKALGVNDVELMDKTADPTNVEIDKEISGNDTINNKIVMINDGKDEGPGNKNVNVVSSGNGRCKIVVIGDDGYSYTTSSGSGKSSETEIIMNGKDKVVDSNRNEVKVIILRSIMVNDVSDSDKLKLRNGVATETVPFSDLKIYPNPVAASLTISYNSSNTKPLQITIYDENGKVVYTEKVNKPGQEVNKTISLSGYAPGIYFVNLLQGNQQETKKIIVGK